LKLRSALLAALLATPLPAVAGPILASAEACFDAAALQPRTVFDVVVSAYPTVFERRLSIKEINRIRPARLPPQAIAHGLSMADFGLRSTVKSEVIGWGPNGSVCAWIGKVTVNLTPESIRIYIPTEYPPGGCESNALSYHELEHEELYRRAVLKAADSLRFALAHARDLSGPAAVIDAAGSDAASILLKRKVDAVVRPIYDGLIKGSRRDQDDLDSPETYRRLGASCSGWKRT
jgi:hypothetical protein